MFKIENKLIAKLQRTEPIDLCRLCLGEDSLREIIGTKLPHMIENCVEVKITSDSIMPKHICTSCFRQIVRFYTYKQKITKVQEVLRRVSEEPCNQITTQSSITTKKGMSYLEIDKFEELENVHEEIQKKTIELNECTQKIISYNFGPPPLVPIQSTYARINIRASLENASSCRIDILPPLIPLNTNEVEHLGKLSCNMCLENFGNLIMLEEHNSKCGFSCNICKERFCDSDLLITHLKGHKKSNKDYLCNICGKKYSVPSTFKVHMRTHTGEKPFKCNICNKSFIRWGGLKTHMIVHENIHPYRCEICGKGFKILSNLYRHKRQHSGVNSFHCNYCDKTFNQSEHLKVHIRIYHTNEKPFLCSECGKAFVSSQRLKRHVWTHSDQKPHPCLLCPKAYANLTDLKNHQLNIHHRGTVSKLFECPICRKTFGHQCRLTKHMKYHKKMDNES